MIKKEDIIFAIINSLVTLVLFFSVQSLYLNGIEDYNVFYLGPWLKSIDEKSEIINTDNFVFIDTNFDNALIENNDNGLINGNIVIADRYKLKLLFEKLNSRSEYKYILCDVFFDRESNIDSALSLVMSKAERLIIPRKDTLEKTIKSFRDVKSGLVDLKITDDKFYKFKLSNKNLKSLPLKMYEEIYSKKNNFNLPLYFTQEGIAFNDFVPYFKIKDKDIKRRGGHYFNLNKILSWNPKSFREITKDKIIIIGNYQTDLHNTIHGKIAGSLILLNVFLSLEEGLNVLSYPLIIILFLIFMFFSVIIHQSRLELELMLSKIPLVGRLSRGSTYILVMTIFSIVIFFVFKNSINLLFVASWFILQNKITKSDIYWKNVKVNLKRFWQGIKKMFGFTYHFFRSIK
ncbi:CHASE2 domain-containing protein [Maribacter sp. MAR_2009_72]|uniref:CHASE2 domain-containing protein n=1 Tax=Maribacter sp. MAR_2009_72 TaxID=1250050 RepID=UPI00119A7FC4|nr:CHASE2 domain-containing protein [Maribacter sp. MAR_2009_72]TVZ13959.1 CHASE2 domain-containing protein [Maribacter sp. MAR_2009_72]